VPKAFGQKFHYLDHDTDVLEAYPPVQNQWYTVFHAYDVRLLWCYLYQSNDESDPKTLEIRWIIDGNTYYAQIDLEHGTGIYIHRTLDPSALGTAGLWWSATIVSAALETDKRGQDFEVQVRITSALGTDQLLRCYCVRETLELT